jgi:hypothetical protein
MTNGTGALSWSTIPLNVALLGQNNSWTATQNFSDIVIAGSTTVVASLVTAIENPTISLGGGVGGSAPLTNDGLDRGIEFQWYSGSAKKGFFGYKSSSQKFQFIPDATVSNGIYSGSLGQAEFGGISANSLTSTGSFNINITTVSSNLALTSSHFMVLCYGTTTITLPSSVGISGRAYIIKKMDSNSTTMTVSTTSGETIESLPSISSVAQFFTLRIVSTGSSWVLF